MLKLRRNLQPAPPPPDPTSKHRGSTYVRFKDVKIGGEFSYRNPLGVIMYMFKRGEDVGYYVQLDHTIVERNMFPDTPVATTEDQLHLHVQMKLRQKRGEPTDNIPTRVPPWR